MAVDAGYRWQLPQRLLELSTSQDYQKALSEWQLEYVYDLEHGEDNEHCLCTHWIRQVCVIKNAQNGKEAMIGNCCIKHFEKDSPAFQGMHTASDCLKRIKSDVTKPPNTGLIQQAFRRGVLNQWEVDFCTRTQKKRNLSEAQQEKRVQINHKLILGICTSAEEALRQLRYNIKASANPRLIDMALKQKVIFEKNAEFYKEIWGKPHGKLTPNQQRYKESLNKKMIAQIKFPS